MHGKCSLEFQCAILFAIFHKRNPCLCLTIHLFQSQTQCTAMSACMIFQIKMHRQISLLPALPTIVNLQLVIFIVALIYDIHSKSFFSIFAYFFFVFLIFGNFFRAI